MNAYSFFKYFHSGFRYIVIILVLAAIIGALAGWFGKKTYTEGNRKLNLFAMISVHTQFLLGLILYFLSPFVQFNSTTMKTPDTRYWTVEHITMMLFAIVNYNWPRKIETDNPARRLSTGLLPYFIYWHL
jgi:uncharacterized membrane protein